MCLCSPCLGDQSGLGVLCLGHTACLAPAPGKRLGGRIQLSILAGRAPGSAFVLLLLEDEIHHQEIKFSLSVTL